MKPTAYGVFSPPPLGRSSPRASMTHQTLFISSFEKYVATECASAEIAGDEMRNRQVRLQRFPYSVVVELSYPELDFAERWCWQNFGPADGDCMQRYSNYRMCLEGASHTHSGKWLRHWLAKTDYDFGYCEFHFSDQANQVAFLAQVSSFNWGEDFAK
jgi:hypothetical protein